MFFGLPLFDLESLLSVIVCFCGLPLYDSESWSAVDKLSIPIVELDSTGFNRKLHWPVIACNFNKFKITFNQLLFLPKHYVLHGYFIT